MDSYTKYMQRNEGEKMTRSELVTNYVSSQINRLVSSMNTSGGKAQLANLRRGIGKTPGELPELWGSFLNGIPEELLSRNGIPTRAEWAVYLALTLFAMHQQGNGESVHAEGMGLGKAAALLMNESTDEERERVLHRFGPAVTAKDMPEIAHHLRNMIQLMKAKGIRLDYVRLSKDLYDFQSEDNRKRVQLRWGQDFYYNEKGESET